MGWSPTLAMLPPYINAAEEHQAENAGVYYRRPDQGIGASIHRLPGNEGGHAMTVTA